MNDYKEEPTPVTRQLVPEDQRLAVVEQLFGIHFPLRTEPVIYGQTGKMTQGQYRGGYWHFYTLDNGGFYMAPEGDQTYLVDLRLKLTRDLHLIMTHPERQIMA